MNWWEKWLHITGYVALTVLGIGAWPLMLIIISCIGISSMKLCKNQILNYIAIGFAMIFAIGLCLVGFLLLSFPLYIILVSWNSILGWI